MEIYMSCVLVLPLIFVTVVHGNTGDPSEKDMWSLFVTQSSYKLIAINHNFRDVRKFAWDPVHTGPNPYGHHLKSLKTSMTLKFVIILQNLIKAYHRKSGKSKYDRKLTELDVETTRIGSRVNGVWSSVF